MCIIHIATVLTLFCTHHLNQFIILILGYACSENKYIIILLVKLFHLALRMFSFFLVFLHGKKTKHFLFSVGLITCDVISFIHCFSLPFHFFSFVSWYPMLLQAYFKPFKICGQTNIKLLWRVALVT